MLAISRNKRIGIALLISSLVHLFIINGVGMPMSRYKSMKSSPLQVELSPETAQEALAPSNQTPTEQKSDPVKQNANNQPPVDFPSNPAPKVEPAEIPIKTEKEAARVEIPTQADQKMEIDQHETSMVAASDQLIPAQNVDMEFILNTADGKPLTKGKQHFESDAGDNYKVLVKRINNENDVTNNVDSNAENWQLEVRGRIYNSTLSPSTYYSSGELANKLLAISHQAKSDTTIKMPPKAGKFPDNILDRQSLNFYYMFLPPTASDNLIKLTDGSKINTYVSHIVEVGFFDSEVFGRLNTIHIRLSNEENSEIIDLWLVPNFKYLPVKIIYSAESGESVIQTLLSIKLN